MKISDRELGRRLAALEGAVKIIASAHLDIVQPDGTTKRMLWTEAMLNVLDNSGSYQGEIMAVGDNEELAALVRTMLL